MKLAALALLAAAALWLLRRALPWTPERPTAAQLMALPPDEFERWYREQRRANQVLTAADLAPDEPDYLAEYRRERLPWERV